MCVYGCGGVGGLGGGVRLGAVGSVICKDVLNSCAICLQKDLRR